MKNSALISILMLILTVLTSCEKEIILDLKNSEEQYVIEGIISDDYYVQTIKITKSIDFYEENQYPTVSNAIVQVIEDNNLLYTFTETSPGIYESDNFIGVPGRTYRLSVTIEGTEYTATSTMPQTVPFIGINYAENVFTEPGEETSYVMIPVFTDPAASRNFYRFNLIIDDELDKGFFPLNDDLINGEVNSFGLSRFVVDKEIVKGSEVTIQMLGIDENVYNYFYVLDQNSDSDNVPNNPKSNISGNILGYFSAQNKQERTIIIP
jgi:hypothetical protein